MKNEPTFYYKKVFENGKLKFKPYPFAAGEKEKYERICDLVIGWGGCPCDVDWAMGTKIFKEAKQKTI